MSHGRSPIRYGAPVVPHWFYPAEPDLRNLALEVCKPCPRQTRVP